MRHAMRLMSGERTTGSLPTAIARAKTSGDVLWVELEHPSREDFEDLAGLLDLHPRAVSDALDARDRPKLDVSSTRPFLSLMTLRRPAPLAPLEVGRVMVWAGEGFVVVVRQERGDTLDRVRARLERGEAAPIDVVHAFVDVVVDDLVALSADVEQSIIACADRLFAEARSDEAPALYQLTRQLLAMTHATQPLLEPVRHLSAGALTGTGAEWARRFQDVHDHLVVLDREVADHGALVEHLRGANDSRIGLQQNTDMRRIAAWAAIIAVPTAVSGFYGMNVPYPGFADVSGLATALVLQILLVVVLVVVFRRRSWL